MAVAVRHQQRLALECNSHCTTASCSAWRGLTDTVQAIDLVSAKGGNRWCVSRERFEHKYRPVPPTAMGQNGPYQARPIPVLAKRIEHVFSIARCAGGDRLQGQAGDWLLQYAPGDFGLAAQSRFAQVYRKAG